MTNAEIRALSLVSVRDAIAAGEVTAEAVVLAAIEQAGRFKTSHGLFVTYTPARALADAAAADQARAAGKPLGPLHGVPITMKDNIDVAGVRTTAGSHVLGDRVPSEDATVVAKLKAAGAIVTLGQTNMHEMAAGGTSNNPHYGAVRNPWAPGHVPGGSSGGAAACVSLLVGHAALGTDAAGSVRMPACLCGVVGLKQTHGLASLKGIVAAGNWSVDHIGPFTRTVADARLMLDVMQGFDPADPESNPTAPFPAPFPATLKGLRVGLPSNYFWEGLDSEVEKACLGVVDILRAEGAELVPLSFEQIGLLALARPAAGVDGFVFHEPYLKDHADWYGEDIRYRYLAAQYVLATDYVRALRARRLVVEELTAKFATVDVVVMPTMPHPAALIAPPPGVPQNTQAQMQNTMPFNQSGLPAISIPAGLTAAGLPIGFQIVASPFQDYKVLGVAAALEAIIGFNVTPPVLREAVVAGV